MANTLDIVTHVLNTPEFYMPGRPERGGDECVSVGRQAGEMVYHDKRMESAVSAYLWYLPLLCTQGV